MNGSAVTTSHDATADWLFAGGGEMRARCREFDWSSTTLGPVEEWPAHLRTAVHTVLASGFSMVLHYGREAVQIYNDACAPSLGDRHPHALGRSVYDCFPEVRESIEQMHRRVWNGETVSLVDQEFTLIVHGLPQSARFTFSYAPHRDEDGTVVGVLVTSLDTTSRVSSDRERATLLESLTLERERLEYVFRHAPSFLSVMRGPDHVMELQNDAFMDLVGARRLQNRPLAEAIPELSDQGFVSMLDDVLSTGETLTGNEMPVGLVRTASGAPELRYVNLSCLPITEPDGSRSGVLAHGFDVTEQVRARREIERLLAESERARADSETARAQVEGILESISDAFYAVDASFRFTYVNHVAEQWWGRTREQLLGRHSWSEFPQLLDGEMYQRHVEVMTSRVPTHFEALSAVLGRWIEVRVFPDETSGGLSCYLRDITEQYAAEERLREADERYRALYTAIDQGFCILEMRYDEKGRPVDYRFLEISPSFERQTGIENGAGKWMRDIAPDQDDTWFERYGRVARTGVAERFEDYSTPLDRWWSVYAFRTGDPELGHVAVLFHDITERKRTEVERLQLLAAITAERERMWALIRHTPAPVALHSGPDHRLEIVSDAFRSVSGGRDVTGMTPREAFPELKGHFIFKQLDRVRATGEPWEVAEVPVRFNRRGLGLEDTWFKIRFEPIRDIDGNVSGVLNFSFDVTDQVLARKQVESLLQAERAARAEAEAANRAKSDFLAVMSHELRTPLNAIGGYAELIELGIHGPISESQRSALARIQQSQRHLLGLISRVLDYARVEAGAVTYRTDDVAVVEAVAEAESLVAPQLRAQGLGYSWSGAAPDLLVRADREKLQQILLNLLSNAVKFTHSREGAPGRVSVFCTASSDRVQIHVQDTGEGVAEEQLERIFEPFVQADQRLTRPHSGVGLGLAISRDLARGMGGDLTAESTCGVGSTFTVTLLRA